MSGRAHERGLSVIEALIAIAILGVALLPLLDLQTQVVRETQRSSAHARELSATRNALAVIEEVNPMLEPAGVRALSEGVTLRWASAPLSRVVRSVGAETADGAFDVALYRLDVVVDDEAARPVAFSVEHLGWRRRDDAE